MKIADKVAREINDQFSEKLAEAFYDKFKIRIETHLSIFSCSMVTTRLKPTQKFTPKQRAFLMAFEVGYLEAMTIARNF